MKKVKWPGVDSGFGIRLLKPHWNRSRIRLRLALDCPESESESTTVGLRWSRNRLRLTGINYKSARYRLLSAILAQFDPPPPYPGWGRGGGHLEWAGTATSPAPPPLMAPAADKRRFRRSSVALNQPAPEAATTGLGAGWGSKYPTKRMFFLD